MGIYPSWGWSWPMNRRVLYNRASCDVSGKPWDASRKQVWWNEAAKRWVGNDVPDFKVDSQPKDHMGPFIMNAEGVGRIFAPLAAFWPTVRFPNSTSRWKARSRICCIPSGHNNPVVKKLFDAHRTSTAHSRRDSRRLHHLSADRALSLLDQKQPDECAARSGALCRDPGGAGSRPRDQRRRPGESFERPRHLYRQGDGDAPHPADDDRMARSCIRSASRFTSAIAAFRKTRDRTARTSRTRFRPR